jgi:hypothetical protein
MCTGKCEERRCKIRESLDTKEKENIRKLIKKIQEPITVQVWQL